MAFKISDSCVGCGTCQSGCPVEAIQSDDGKFKIDQDKCVQCGTCQANCPAGAIVEE